MLKRGTPPLPTHTHTHTVIQILNCVLCQPLLNSLGYFAVVQSLNFLRMASRIDAVAQRVETAVRMNKVTKDMSGVVKAMESAASTMNLEKVGCKT